MSAATFSADADNKDEEDVVEVLDAMGPLRAPVSSKNKNKRKKKGKKTEFFNYNTVAY